MLPKQRRKVRFPIYHNPSSKHLQEHYFQNILERQYPPVFRLLKLTLALHVPKPRYRWDDLWRQCCTSKKKSPGQQTWECYHTEATTSITEPRGAGVCACALPCNPAQPHLFQQLKRVKWTRRDGPYAWWEGGNQSSACRKLLLRLCFIPTKQK